MLLVQPVPNTADWDSATLIVVPYCGVCHCLQYELQAMLVASLFAAIGEMCILHSMMYDGRMLPVVMR